MRRTGWSLSSPLPPQWETLLCSSESLNKERLVLGGGVWGGGRAAQPGVEHRPCDVAFERAESITRCFTASAAGSDVLRRRRVGTALGDGNAVEGRVQLAIAATIEAVMNVPGRGRLQGSDTGVGSELRVRAKAARRAELRSDCRSRQCADTVDLEERRVVSSNELREFARKQLLLVDEKRHAVGKAGNGGEPVWHPRSRRVGPEGAQRSQGRLRSQGREHVFIARVEDEELGVQVVSQARQLRHDGVSFPDHHVHEGRDIVGQDTRQVRRLLADDERDGARIQPVGLVLAAGVAALLSRPARVDIEDREASAHKELGKATPVAARALDTDLTGSRQAFEPLGEGKPIVRELWLRQSARG